MPTKVPNLKRQALQQYWHEGGSTGIYARATLRTLQFCSAIIIIGLYGSELNYRSNQSDTPITNEIYALVVGLLSVVTVGLHCFLTVKRVPFIFWDFVVCVLYAALAGTYGTTYLAVDGVEELEATDRVRSLEGMKAAVAFDLLGLVLWLCTFLQGSIWCCRARRFTRKTDVEEMVDAPSTPEIESWAAKRERTSSDDVTLYAESLQGEEKKEKPAKEVC